MKKLFLLTAISVFLSFYLIFGPNGVLKYSYLLGVEEKYYDKLSELNLRTEQVKRELELVKSGDNYTFYLIRKDLGLQHSDEYLFIIPEPSSYAVKE